MSKLMQAIYELRREIHKLHPRADIIKLTFTIETKHAFISEVEPELKYQSAAYKDHDGTMRIFGHEVVFEERKPQAGK